MSNYTDGIMDVSLYETRADTTTFMAAEAGEFEARKAAGDSATDVLQLCAEVRRLQAGIQAVRDEAERMDINHRGLTWWDSEDTTRDLESQNDAQSEIIQALDTALGLTKEKE